MDKSAAFEPHNHRSCAGQTLARAEEMAAREGLRLTPVRRRVLEILLEEHRALGAYDVLEKLAAEGFGHQPPVAYRALEFLVENGFAHRVRRLNAFAACMSPGEMHAPAFFICSGCGAVAELPAASVREEVEAAANEIGFRVDRMNVEVSGICPTCRQAEEPAC